MSDEPANLQVASQVAALEKQLAEFRQAMATARWIRTGLLLALVAVAGISGWQFYALAQRVRSQENIDKLVTVAQERLDRRGPEWIKQGQLLLDEATPQVSSAFYAQAKKDLPAYFNTIEQERDAFVQNLTERLSQQVSKHFARNQEQFTAILESEFPAAQSPQAQAAIMTNVKKVAERLAQKYYAEALEKQVHTAYGLLDSFPPAPKPEIGDATLEDQLVVSTVDLLTMTLTDNTASQTGAVRASDQDEKPAPMKEKSAVKAEKASVTTEKVTTEKTAAKPERPEAKADLPRATSDKPTATDKPVATEKKEASE